MASPDQVFDQVIVGGGIAGLLSAYEILHSARGARQSYSVAVLADKINAPTSAGSNLSLGLEGLGKNETPSPKLGEIHRMLVSAIREIGEIVGREKIDCRLQMGYQYLGKNPQELKETEDWLIDFFGYKKDDLKPIDRSQKLAFEGLLVASRSDAIGQINVPEFQKGLIRAIRRMGGTVQEGVRYLAHERAGEQVSIATDTGLIASRSNPLLAMGGALELLGIPVTTKYTIAMHVPLSPEDAKRLAPDGMPTGFCDTAIEGDVFWGSLDKKKVLTFGFGETLNPQDRPTMEAALKKRFEELLPHLKGKYDKDMSFSFGPMTMTENGFPLVGRLPNFDVNSGWCSRGIVGSAMAAKALADYYVLGNTKALAFLEDLNVTGIRNALMAAPPSPSSSYRPKQAKASPQVA